MLAGLVLISLAAALISGAVAWFVAGFWWGLVAYVGIGAATILLVAAVRALDPQTEGAHAGHLINPKAAS